MKTGMKLALMGILLFGMISCEGQNSKVEESKLDLITTEFPEEKQEVMETFGE
ncbi:hypothetical protein [Zobellia amurskyensis]|uniref:hypothetical protein n=1 Tax=Zobellia amurskyensis TaxID=248905 RepID=UPI001F324D7D|nr:hypothetical protein [Zobellia amurskyensis]